VADEETERKVAEYIEIVKAHFELEMAILFGSHLRGEANKYSDIDVALIVKKKPGAKCLDDEVLLYKLRRDVDLSISPTLFYMDEYEEREPASFISEVLRTGKIIYKEDKFKKPVQKQ